MNRADYRVVCMGLKKLHFKDNYASPKLHFLVACTRLYDPLCPSVGRSHLAFLVFSPLLPTRTRLRLVYTALLNFGLQLLPNRPRLDCRVSDLVLWDSTQQDMDASLYPRVTCYINTDFTFIITARSEKWQVT